MATIAVGFVDSPEGQEVLAVAHGLAVRSGARLRVIAVLHPSGRLDPTMADGLRPQCSELLERRHRRDVQAALALGVAASRRRSTSNATSVWVTRPKSCCASPSTPTSWSADRAGTVRCAA